MFGIMKEKRKESNKIQKDIDAYLEQGGVIDKLPTEKTVDMIKNQVIKGLAKGKSIDEISKTYKIDRVVVNEIKNTLSRKK